MSGESEEKSISVVGLGNMGSALADVLLSNGFSIAVWNRTVSKATTLIERGATLAQNVAEAAGMSPSIVQLSNLAHDIDDHHDLELAIVGLPPSFTRSYLESSGIAARLNGPRSRQTSGFPRARSTASQWT